MQRTCLSFSDRCCSIPHVTSNEPRYDRSLRYHQRQSSNANHESTKPSLLRFHWTENVSSKDAEFLKAHDHMRLLQIANDNPKKRRLIAAQVSLFAGQVRTALLPLYRTCLALSHLSSPAPPRSRSSTKDCYPGSLCTP